MAGGLPPCMDAVGLYCVRRATSRAEGAAALAIFSAAYAHRMRPVIPSCRSYLPPQVAAPTKGRGRSDLPPIHFR